MHAQLPSHCSLRQLKSQAKDLHKACAARDAAALDRVRAHHPRHSNATDADLAARPLSLQAAQLVIARELGFESWPRLAAAVGERAGTAAAGPFPALIGASEAMAQVRQRLAQAAAVSVPVLLKGEKGVGKRLAARLIHGASARATGPYLTMECDVSPELLGDSELLGHEPGAFTGANAPRRGKVEEAAGGSLLLISVEALSRAAQRGLMEIIDRAVSKRVGGVDEMKVDVRLIAATAADLKDRTESGRLREDLFYSLQAVGIEVPPLRQRREDVPDLAHHFAASATRSSDVVFAEEAMARLTEHDWPGNVRELRHTVEGAVAAAGTGEIELRHLAIRTD